MNNNTKAAESFNRVTRLGHSLDTGHIYINIDYKVEDGKGKLSITGVEGPLSSGNARGSCGQLNDHLKHYLDDPTFNLAPDWDADSLRKLADVWDRWHLNNMQAGCSHQRAAWDTTKKLEVVEYGTTIEAYRMREAAQKRCIEAALQGKVARLSPRQEFVLDNDRYFKTVYHTLDGVEFLDLFEEKKRETKAAGWLKPHEHPEGILGKPCPTCGHRYGSGWLHEPVPADVLEWLSRVPAADRKPAWV